MNAKELSVILEAAIDQHDLCGVLGLIENICYIKAERTMADLLDEDLANLWQEAGEDIEGMIQNTLLP